MAITQLLPFSDTVAAGESAAYTNQINVSGTVATPTYTTISNPTDALSVSPGGAIVTVGYLDIGTYEVSGNVTDGYSNGTWSFTLTVTGAPAPQSGLVPVAADLPTGIEIAVPFHIDEATGGVAYLSDYGEIMQQHVLTIIMTYISERVMLPAYGTRVRESVFSPISAMTSVQMTDTIQKAIAAWEPSVTVLGVNTASSLQSPTTLTITVNYQIQPFKDVNSITIQPGGAIQQVSTFP